jgi:hypothetical protein
VHLPRPDEASRFCVTTKRPMCLLRIGVMRAMRLLLFLEHPLNSFFADHLRWANTPLKVVHICGDVCVGKLCKKRALILSRSIMCEIVLGSSTSRNPLIYNIKYTEDMRKEKEKKNGSRAQQFQRRYGRRLR